MNEKTQVSAESGRKPVMSRWAFPDLIRRCAAAWLSGVTVAYLLLPAESRGLGSLAAVEAASGLTMLLVGMGVLVLISVLSGFFNTVKYERWFLTALFPCLGAAGLISDFTWPFLAAIVLFEGLLIRYAFRGWEPYVPGSMRKSVAHPACAAGTGVLALLVFLLLCGWTVGRVLCFYTPSYDFGIFSQMFYSMKTTGLPVTTLEREVTMSHFRVHVSPIYYLLLPLYYLFPTPTALQVFQAAVMVSAVIPLWMLGKHHGLSGFQRLLLCAVLLFFPAFAGGAGYDLHENCFLTPLILWLFLGVDRKHTVLTFCAGVLILCVKEDAAVYTAVTGLWVLVRALLRKRENTRWNCIMGLILLAGSVAWFLGVCAFLKDSGDGVMTYRYSNFMYGGKNSLATVILAVVRNPLKLIYECCDREKMSYLGLTILPLLGLPLFTRRYERYILLIPYLLMNLMSDYIYQHHIFFQYSFGTTAFLVYLAAVNLSEFQQNRNRTRVLLAAAAVCAGCFGAVIVPKAMQYPVQWIQLSGHYRQQRELLEIIPPDASVSAGTFYTTYLSQRHILYDIRYATKAQILLTEYVVVDGDTTDDFAAYGSGEMGRAAFLKFLEENDYVLMREIPGTLSVFCRKQQ